MKDSVKPPHDGAIGPAVAISGGVYDFPGWSNVVDGNGNFTGAQIPAADSVVVGARHRPPARAHRTARSRSTAPSAPAWPPPARCPTPRQGTGYNLVQKARASNLGGFWKVEIRGFGNGLGHVLCTLGDGRNVLTAESAARVDDGNVAHLRLPAQRQRLVGRRGRRRRQRRRHHPRLGHPVERFSTAVTIGKKPGSTDPSDSFSGWLDELNISAG